MGIRRIEGQICRRLYRWICGFVFLLRFHRVCRIGLPPSILRSVRPASVAGASERENKVTPDLARWVETGVLPGSTHTWAPFSKLFGAGQGCDYRRGRHRLAEHGPPLRPVRAWRAPSDQRSTWPLENHDFHRSADAAWLHCLIRHRKANQPHRILNLRRKGVTA